MAKYHIPSYFFPIFYLFYLLGLKIQHPTIKNVTYTIHLGKLFLFVLAILAVVIIHELIQAFFFKLFKPKSKVQFGINWKLGAAYATCPKVTYDRWQMIVISLTPFYHLVSNADYPLWYEFIIFSCLYRNCQPTCNRMYRWFLLCLSPWH